MSTLNAPPVIPSETKSSAGYLVLAGMLLFFGCCVLGVVGMFHLSSEATVLRETVMSAVPGPWHKTIALRVGWITTGLVRSGSRFFHMPPEPRAALEALHGVEVGVYNLRDEPAYVQRGAILVQADKAMAARGWVRVVGVVEEHDLVTVYMPRKGVSSTRMKVCVAVFSGRDLVVVSARGNLEPLRALVEQHLERDPQGHLVAWRDSVPR